MVDEPLRASWGFEGFRVSVFWGVGVVEEPLRALSFRGGALSVK